jgi:spore maturation protein SpmA
MNAQADAQWDVADSQGWLKRISKLEPPNKRLMPEISTGHPITKII